MEIIIVVSAVLLIVILFVIVMRRWNDYSLPAVDIFPKKELKYRLLVISEDPYNMLFLSGHTIAKYVNRKNISVRILQLKDEKYNSRKIYKFKNASVEDLKYSDNKIKSYIQNFKPDAVIANGMHKDLTNIYMKAKNFDLYFPVVSDKMEFLMNLNLKTPNLCIKKRIFSFSKVWFTLTNNTPALKISFIKKINLYTHLLLQNREYFYKVPK